MNRKRQLKAKGIKSKLLTGNDQMLGSACIPLLDDEEGAFIVWLS